MKPILQFSFFVLLSYNSVIAQDFLSFKEHIPGGWIVNFDFFEDGILIADKDSPYLQYYNINQNLDIDYQYTVNGAASKFFLKESYLYVAQHDELHTIQLEKDSYNILTSGELMSNYNHHYNPISYHNENVYFSSGTEYFRFDVSDPYNPIQTGRTDPIELDLNHSIIADDNYIYASRQLGTAYPYSIRILDNLQSDTIISKGLYADIGSYTADVKKYENLLILAHVSGLKVYDVSDIDNMILKFSFDSDWGRCLEMVDNFIILGSNGGWDVFEIKANAQIDHIQRIDNDSRVWKIKYREESNELWSSVDGGALSGLVVFDVLDIVSATENKHHESLKFFPNPTDGLIKCDFRNQNIQELKITDLTGKYIVEKVNLLQNEMIDLSNFSDGIYFITIQIDDKLFTSKIIKR